MLLFHFRFYPSQSTVQFIGFLNPVNDRYFSGQLRVYMLQSSGADETQFGMPVLLFRRFYSVHQSVARLHVNFLLPTQFSGLLIAFHMLQWLQALGQDIFHKSGLLVRVSFHPV